MTELTHELGLSDGELLTIWVSDQDVELNISGYDGTVFPLRDWLKVRSAIDAAVDAKVSDE